MWWSWGPSWFAMMLMMSGAFAAWAILLLIVWKSDFRWLHPKRTDRNVADASEVLALRLARGDIDAGEYLDRINALANGASK